MRLSSLIGHVIEIYSKFALLPEKPADLQIRHFFYDRKYLGSTDRRFIADAYFGTIKNYLRLEAIIRDADASMMDAETGDSVFSALTVAAYFIAIQAMDADAVNDAILESPITEAKAIPRSTYHAMADRAREESRLAGLAHNERLATLYSFPVWFVDRLISEYNEDEAEGLLRSMNDEAPTVLRANRLIIANREELAKELEAEGCATSPSLIAEQALILPRRVNVMNSKAFKRGAFEMQDEASQLVAPIALPVPKPLKVLDACAGAGGKTLHLAALLDNRGEIFATDVDGYKLDELKKRTRRANVQNVRILYPDRHDAELARKKGWFDVVLLDVPCSGTGTLRRNPGIKWLLTETMVSELIEKQFAILEEHAEFVKTGGALVYATCSVLKEEAEDQMERFVRHHPEFVLEATLRTRPDKDGCDGFFAARLRRS